jgi:hypothetical protein
MNVQKVYDPKDPTSLKVLTTPDDLVGWFEAHPGLVTTDPVAVTVGGLSGQQFDILTGPPLMPAEYFQDCGDRACLPLWPLSDGGPYKVLAAWQVRIIVLDVRGETIAIVINGPGSQLGELDEVYPQAKEVLDTIEFL